MTEENQARESRVNDGVNNPAIVVHYHELWLKGCNRRFFLGKLFTALRLALQGLPIVRIEQPGERFLVRLGEGAPLDEVMRRMERIPGVAYYAVARPVERDMDALCRAAWEEIEPQRFADFAVRAKRSDKTFLHSTMEIESTVGRYLLEELRAQGREVRVRLNDPEVTCRIEITPGPLLVYAHKIPGVGGLPANTAGRTRIGCSTPLSRIDSARACSAASSKCRRGWKRPARTKSTGTVLAWRRRSRAA